MKKGFIPALGTPLTTEGRLMKESYVKQIRDQIKEGAAGLLCMGSMGIEPFIRADVYPEVAKAAVEAAEGKVPVFVGAMDTSIERVKQRIEPLEELDIAGLVFTAPYYEAASRNEILSFYREVAKLTKHNILAYDLPPVTQAKITYDMVLEMIETIPNYIGIKSADTQMFRKLSLNPAVSDDFIMVYSGLDIFDIAYKWGIDKCLDGMLSCTPTNTGKMFKAMESGDYRTAGECLNNIISLRDLFVDHDLWPCYTYAMNLLGYEGYYAPDYVARYASDEAMKLVKDEMIRIGENVAK